MILKLPCSLRCTFQLSNIELLCLTFELILSLRELRLKTNLRLETNLTKA